MEATKLYNYYVLYYSTHGTPYEEMKDALDDLEDLWWEMSKEQMEFCHEVYEKEKLIKTNNYPKYLAIYFDWLRSPEGDNMDYRNRMETIWLTLSREEREFCEYVHARRKELGL